MSLTPDEMARTAEDLGRHLTASGLSTTELAAWLGLSDSAIGHVLAMDGEADPVTVWLVRDALDQAVEQTGAQVPGWQVLTEAARRRGQQWFALREVPIRN